MNQSTHARAALVAVLLLGACADGANICGEGLRPSATLGRCVPIDGNAPPPETDMGTPDARTDAMDPGPDASGDAPPDASMDADSDASALDGSEPDAEAGAVGMAAGTTDADTGTAVVDTGVPDTGTPTDDGGTDATTDANDTPAGPTCTSDDVAAWSSFHLSTSLLGTIEACTSDPRCALGLCPLVQCMHDGAGLGDCEDCVAEESACVFDHCYDACSPDSSDAKCLACACDAGCPALFEECSGQTLNVCDACEPAILYCKGMHPWPALLVPILHPL